MNVDAALNKSGSFILSQMGFVRDRGDEPRPPGPGVTISQRAGSGAHTIAEHVAEMLQKFERREAEPWRVFDRQLVEQALEEHHLPKRLARYMPEDRQGYIEDVVEEVLGLRPPSWILVPQVVETIQHLLKAGHVIVVGRAAAAIASDMEGIFHVRLVASLNRRIERVQRLGNLTRSEAIRFIEVEDRGSRRYARAHFHANIEDEMLYHLIINTDRISYPDAARLIVDEARRCFEKARQLHLEGRQQG